MELNKLKILENIGKVYEDSKNCKLDEEFFTKIDVELSYLSTYFKTTKPQAFFISIVFALNYKGDTVDLNDLIDYFDCNPMKLLEYNDEFNYLNEMNIFARQKSRHRVKLAAANNQFSIHEKISQAILENKPMPEINSVDVSDIYDLLEKLDELMEQCYDEEISTGELLAKSRRLINTNLQFPLINKVNTLKLNTEDYFFYLIIIWKTVSGDQTTNMNHILERIFNRQTRRVKYMQSIIAGKNKLIEKNLIELQETSFLNDSEVLISDYTTDLLKEVGIKLLLNKKKKDNLIYPADIPVKKLIFSESEMSQVFVLKKLLQPKKFKETQARLTAKNLPKGVAVLLHGVPGTGKTELVKQLARETKRELMKVEISQSKSMWFGESEKLIKKIFTDYNSLLKESDRTPILLFNEADAILSKRSNLSNSGVSKTENAIQNILLEEIENFEGILIATTNLTNNLDAAFDRRFLFKVKFNKPDLLISAQLWKLKLPFLKASQCKFIAANYEFSGGQIENIMRKTEIHEVIQGKTASFDEIINFCSEESMNSVTLKIGF